MVGFLRRRIIAAKAAATAAAAAGAVTVTGQVPAGATAKLSRRAFGGGAASLLGDAIVTAAGAASFGPVTLAAGDEVSFVYTGQTPVVTVPGTPVPAAVNGFRTGVYAPTGPGRVAAWNTFLDRAGSEPTDFAELHAGRQSWVDIEGSTGFMLNDIMTVGAQKEIRFCPPLFANIYGADTVQQILDGFASVTGGANDAQIRKLARTIIGFCHPTSGKFKQARTIIRAGQEFNGHFQPWRISLDNVTINQQLAQASRAARRRYATIFREVETEKGLPNGYFLFDLCLNFTSPVNNPEWWYPGDQYTDRISTDVYYNPQYSQPTTAQGWFEFIRDSQMSGMAFVKNFALNAANRPTIGGEVPSGSLLWGIPEFGIKTDGNTEAFAAVVPLIADYLQANGAEGWGYWDEEGTDAGNYQSMVSNGHLPFIGAKIKDIFRRVTTGAPTIASKYTGATVPAYVPPATGSNLVASPKDLSTPSFYKVNATTPAANRVSWNAGAINEFGQTAAAGLGMQDANASYRIKVTMKLISGTPGNMALYVFDNFSDNVFDMAAGGIQVGQTLTYSKDYDSTGSGGGRNMSIRNTGSQGCVWELQPDANGDLISVYRI